MGESGISEGTEEVILLVQSLTKSLKSTMDFLKREGRTLLGKTQSSISPSPFVQILFVWLIWFDSLLFWRQDHVLWFRLGCNSLYRSSWSGTRGGSLPDNSGNASMTHMTDIASSASTRTILRDSLSN